MHHGRVTQTNQQSFIKNTQPGCLKFGNKYLHVKKNRRICPQRGQNIEEHKRQENKKKLENMQFTQMKSTEIESFVQRKRL